jgi:hypothetical protein
MDRTENPASEETGFLRLRRGVMRLLKCAVLSSCILGLLMTFPGKVQSQPSQMKYMSMPKKAMDNLGDEWEVQEGSWKGVWTRRGKTDTFDAVWTTMSGFGSTKRVTAVLTITQSGDSVRIQRRYSSDGNDCEYQGKMSRDGSTFRASGTLTCKAVQGTHPWSAVIRYQAGKMEVADQKASLTLGSRWETWESELSAAMGMGGEWKGTWVRIGTTNMFNATWILKNQKVTAVLTMELDGNTVSIQRRQSSDGNDCNYKGTIASDGFSVQGSYSCSKFMKTVGRWRAIIRP